ncbi:MAG: c-type cytochrome [Thiomargarita sp.]|nr:c-type cytochrome [Thiomargarita sp.]
MTSNFYFHYKIPRWTYIFLSIFLSFIWLFYMPLAQSSEAGKTIYQSFCVSCHTIGKGRLVGPDLKGVTELRETAWLVRWIREPNKMVAEGDPLVKQLLAEYNNIPMPSFGLSKTQAEDILAYIKAESNKLEMPPKVIKITDEFINSKTSGTNNTDNTAAININPNITENTLLTDNSELFGNAVIGKKLFTGQQTFSKGSPACIACHRNTAIKGLGGGTLGPDLTKVFSRYGGEIGLNSVLTSTPFPTMQGVFSKKPVSDVEAEHLTAFFAKTDKLPERPVNIVFIVIGIGIGVLGFIASYILMHFIWRNRLTGVRKPLVGR